MVFHNCQFIGGTQINCQNFGASQFDGCRYDEDATLFINSETIKAGKRKYDSENLRADIQTVVAKFMGKGGIGFKTVKAADLVSGRISVSPHKAAIIEEVIKYLVDKHEISGIGAGYHAKGVAKDAIRFFLTNNVFTGPLEEIYRRLVKKLDL
jgi:hypothetical protein